MKLDRPRNRMRLLPPAHAAHAAPAAPLASFGIALGLGLLLLHARPVPAQASPDQPSDSAARSAPAAPDAAAPDAADSAPAAQSGQTLEAVNMSVQGSFTGTSPRVGDSLDYVLRVEWPDAGVPVVVLAPDSLDFRGFQVISQSTVHKKLVLAGGIGNRTEFIYRLRAATPGGGKASSLKVRYLSGVSRNEEAVFAPAAHIDILPARIPLRDTLWFRLLAGSLVLAGAGAAAWSAFRVTRRRRRSRAAPARIDLKPEVLALKSRIRKAALASPGDSKSILLQMEDLCIRYLRQELDGAGGREPSAGPAASGDARAPKFDPLLDRYLARAATTVGGGNGDGDGAAEWNGMRELFRHARFAGGHKEPHELQEAYRSLKKALRITDEPGDE